MVRQGIVAGRGAAGLGQAGRGKARHSSEARLGVVGHGRAWYVMAGFGRARPGSATLGIVARRGAVRRC